jgi:hypothetical protein
LEPTVSEANLNPVTDPVVKRILVKTRKERITDPKNTEGGIADPTNHPANFPHLMIIAYSRGRSFPISTVHRTSLAGDIIKRTHTPPIIGKL